MPNKKTKYYLFKKSPVSGRKHQKPQPHKITCHHFYPDPIKQFSAPKMLHQVMALFSTRPVPTVPAAGETCRLLTDGNETSPGAGGLILVLKAVIFSIVPFLAALDKQGALLGLCCAAVRGKFSAVLNSPTTPPARTIFCCLQTALNKNNFQCSSQLAEQQKG